MGHWLKWGLIYAWVAPNSCLGLIAAMLAVLHGGQVRLVGGVLEVASEDVTRFLGKLTWVGRPIAAITLGHVVVGASPIELQRTRRHERVHVRQYERWGPFFIPAYFLSSGWVWLRGGHPYLDNPFEQEAYAVSDGGEESEDGENWG